MIRKATQQQTKEHNRDLVLKMIFDHDRISRAEIARKTGLTRTTVSDLVAELITEGLVSEVGMGESLGGKSPILLSLVEDSRYLIGLDLALNQFRAAVVNLRGKICKLVCPPVQDCSPEEALELVYSILDELVHSDLQPIVGIGVGTPGLVNSHTGVVVHAVNLGWRNLPLAGLLRERYQMPVYVLNDSQAAAMGEYTYGESQPADGNLVVINARHGIGAGIVINGRLFYGDGGAAGEIGHIVMLPEGGLPCRCGNYGCLETVASAQAIVTRTRLLASQSMGAPASNLQSFEDIELAFATGDPLVRQVVLEAGRYMGLAISSLVGTLNIRRIILTGDMTRFGQPWLDAIRDAMGSTTLSRLAQETQVEIGQLGGNNVVLGASALLANNYSLLFNQKS